jgi:hypothetical protein
MTRTSLLVLLLSLAFTGCKKDGMENGDSANALRVDRDSCPEWLLLKIEEIESWHKADSRILKVRIFQGEWENRTAYFIKNSLSSCYFCEVYYEDGEQVAFNESSEEFGRESAHWAVIYEYGNAIGF